MGVRFDFVMPALGHLQRPTDLFWCLNRSESIHLNWVAHTKNVHVQMVGATHRADAFFVVALTGGLFFY
jgi:hypothetical protein